MTDPLPWRTLRPGESINRWRMSCADERRFPGLARPMQDRVDYRFMTGWVDTGDLPCREALKTMVASGREIAFREGPLDEVYAGGDAPNVDFSQFRHLPTLITRTLQCTVRAEEVGSARFEIETCGGVTVWLEHVRILQFEPFTRNHPARTTFGAALSPEAQDLTVRLEELHERDTACFFRLTFLDGTARPAVALRGVDPVRLGDALDTLGDVRTERVFYESGPVRAVSDHAPRQTHEIRLTSNGQFPRGGISGFERRDPGVAFRLGPQDPGASLFDVADAEAGCLRLVFETKAEGARLAREIGVTALPAPVRLDQPTLAARKAAALDRIVARADFEPSVALALLKAGAAPARVESILGVAIYQVNSRFDCADFTLLPLIWIWAEERKRLVPKVRSALRAAILGFRYWLDEPGDDVMWFWSENHVLCFHVAQLAAGALFPGETFANSGRSGAALARDAGARLERWFTSIETHGLGEWNSSAYYPIDLLALLALHRLSPDPGPKERAAVLMDEIFAMSALHTIGGVPAGSQGRAYEKELLAGPATELGALTAVAFGGDWRPGYERAAALFCLSDYAPPEGLARLAAPSAGDRIHARYAQGLDRTAKLTLWKTAHAQLSSVSEHRTGEVGHQQHVVDLQFAGHPMARAWINHPGDLKPWSERRPSMLAGNARLPRVAQAANTAFLIYDLARDPSAIPFTQLFAVTDAFDAVETHGDWIVLRSGQGLAAIWCSAPLAPVDTGLYRGCLWRAEARRVGWIVHVDDADAPDAATFRATVAAARPGFDPDRLALEVAALGPERVDLAHDRPLLIGGARQAPWPEESRPQIEIGGAPAHWRDALAWAER